MKNSIKRILRTSLVLLLTLCIFFSLTSCAIIERIRDGAPTPPSSTSPSPTLPALPTPGSVTVDPIAQNEAAEALSALDMKIFAYYVTSDPLSYKLAIKHPENFDFGEVENSWGEFTLEANNEALAQMEEWLNELYAINYAALNADDKLTYETFEFYLKMNIESGEFYYYSEPLTPLVGMHTNLPFNFALYQLDNEADVVNYLALLADTPRFMLQVLEFEQEKSALGLFMTDYSLDEVLEQLDEFIDSGDDCFLYGTFEETVRNVDGLSNAQMDAFIAENAVNVKALLDSYKTLRNGMEALRGTNTNAEGMLAYGEEGKNAFLNELKYVACSDITPEEAYNLLYEEMYAQMDEMMDAIRSSPTVYDQYGTLDLDLGSMDANMGYLKELYKDYYPEIPSHTVRYMDVPKDLESQFSPAAYLVPPVDDASENLVIINQSSMASSSELLFTLAHEGYPGHMYHYIYLRSLLEKTGYTRQALSLTGYAESMSSYGEMFFANYNTKFSNDYCVLMLTDTSIGNLIIPALCSLGINYFGWGESDLQDLLGELYSSEVAQNKEVMDMFYELSIKDPYYFLEYAVGFSLLRREARDAKEELGTNFDLKAFHKAFLDIGQTYFHLIESRMDEWVATQK